MSRRLAPVANQDLPTLVGGIARDTGTLLNQQVELLRAEVAEELRRVGAAAASIAAGGGLTAAGGLLSGMMLAHLLHRVTRLPLWVCYGIVGSGISATGMALLLKGSTTIAHTHLVPPETTKALKENVAWLKQQLGNPNPPPPT